MTCDNCKERVIEDTQWPQEWLHSGTWRYHCADGNEINGPFARVNGTTLVKVVTE